MARMRFALVHEVEEDLCENTTQRPTSPEVYPAESGRLWEFRHTGIRGELRATQTGAYSVIGGVGGHCHERPAVKASAIMRKRSYNSLTSTLQKPQSSIAFHARMRSGAIVTQSTNSLNGIAPSRDYRSARLWSSDTECIWNPGSSRLVQSASVSVRYAALLTKRPAAGFSARIRPRVDGR